MGVLDRLKIALQSEVGALLFGLGLIVVTLVFIYLVLSQRKKKSDLLAYRYQSHFEAAEARLKGFSFTAPHKPSLFGRETVGKWADGTVGLCRIAPPTLATAEVTARFSDFYRVTKGQKLPVLAPLAFVEGPITIQSSVVSADGQKCPSAQELMADAVLNEAQVEEVLLEATRALASLHNICAEGGGPLYHGWLIPDSFRIDYDPQGKVRELLISDAGVAFSLGPKRLYHLIERLRHGKAMVGKNEAARILEQIAMLAPEQREESRLSAVGPASDFYAFGALAVTLFSRTRFTSDAIPWDALPTKWRPFLERCLNDDPAQRPSDFMEITDWLFDPGLALSRHEGANKEEAVVEEKEVPQYAVGDLQGMLHKMQKSKSGKHPIPEGAQRFVDRGQSALSQSKWALATSFFLKARDHAPDHPEVLLGLAIAHYEQGSLAEAEKHHQKLQQIDPEVGKRFHEHLACKR